MSRFVYPLSHSSLSIAVPVPSLGWRINEGLLTETEESFVLYSCLLLMRLSRACHAQAHGSVCSAVCQGPHGGWGWCLRLPCQPLFALCPCVSVYPRSIPCINACPCVAVCVCHVCGARTALPPRPAIRPEYSDTPVCPVQKRKLRIHVNSAHLFAHIQPETKTAKRPRPRGGASKAHTL